MSAYIMNAVQLASFVLQLMQLAPDLDRTVTYYTATCRRLHGFFTTTSKFKVSSM